MASQTNKDTTNGETQQQPNQIPTLKLIPGQQQNVRVAVIGIISNGKGQVVAGRRIGPLGGGTLSFPGGHLEFGESIFSCVERETLEESGLVVRGSRIIGVTNDFFVESNLHYITVWAVCERIDPTQQPQRLEPNKCEGWTWTDWAEIERLAARDVALEESIVSGGQQQQKQQQRELFVPLFNLVKEYPELGSDIKSQSVGS